MCCSSRRTISSAACIGVAVGAIGGAVTAGVSTYIADGSVDWEAVGCYAGAGAIVGGVTSIATYGISKAVQTIAQSTNKSLCTATETGSQKVAQGQGYKSFEALKNAQGRAGDNRAWHHIVEQNSTNINRFGAQSIHNTKNVVNIPSGFTGSLHGKITGLYNSINSGITGSSTITVREWLVTKSFDFQYQFGVDVLVGFAKELGITILIP